MVGSLPRGSSPFPFAPFTYVKHRIAALSFTSKINSRPTIPPSVAQFMSSFTNIILRFKCHPSSLRKGLFTDNHTTGTETAIVIGT